MRKKTFYLFLLILLPVAFYFLFFPKSQGSKSCPFCNPQIVETQKFYEDDEVIALCTHRPIFKGHALIIPKRHVARFEELTASEILKIGEMIKKVDVAAKKAFGTSSYLILQKNGKEVGQTVFHVHFHYIPRKLEDNSTLKFLFKMYVVNKLKPLNTSEIQDVVLQFKEALSQS